MAKFIKKMKQEIMAMLEIEELNIAIYFLFKQFKEEYAEILSSYFLVKKRDRISDHGGMRLVKNRKNWRYSKSYRFELESFFPGQSRISHWGIRKFSPRGYMNPSHLIPQKMRCRMAEEPVDADRMKTLEFFSDELEKSFQVTFTRLNEEKIVGKIREIACSEKNIEDGELQEYVDIKTEGLRHRNHDNSYIELYLYMEKYPSLRAEVFDRFFLLQKPRLQQEMSEENQDSSLSSS